VKRSGFAGTSPIGWGLGWSLFVLGAVYTEMGRFTEACLQFQYSNRGVPRSPVRVRRGDCVVLAKRRLATLYLPRQLLVLVTTCDRSPSQGEAVIDNL
jgi:hypothetical protein